MPAKKSSSKPAASPSGGGGRVQRVLLALATLLVLAVGAFVGLAWYYAGQIEAGALRLDHEQDPFELRVAAVGDGEITLVREAGDTRLDEPGILGLVGPKGYGRIRDVREFDRDRVVRGYVPFDGEIATGDLVRFDKAWFPGDPARSMKIRFEDVQVRAKIGDLPAWYVPGTGDTWAILVHGRTASRAETLRALKTVTELKLPALVITYRNDPEVPADPSGYYQFGVTEWQDLEAAVKYALNNGADHVVLFGFSMGGAIVTNFLYQSKISDEVAGVVLDSPVLDFSRTVDLAAEERRLPQALTDAAKLIASLRFGIDWKATNYLSRIEEIEAPVLLIHGDADKSVPVSTSDQLARERRDLVTYLRVPAAGHVASWNVNPDKYDASVRDFLSKVAVKTAYTLMSAR